LRNIRKGDDRNRGKRRKGAKYSELISERKPTSSGREVKRFPVNILQEKRGRKRKST